MRPIDVPQIVEAPAARVHNTCITRFNDFQRYVECELHLGELDGFPILFSQFLCMLLCVCYVWGILSHALIRTLFLRRKTSRFKFRFQPANIAFAIRVDMCSAESAVGIGGNVGRHIGLLRCCGVFCFKNPMNSRTHGTRAMRATHNTCATHTHDRNSPLPQSHLYFLSCSYFF